MNYRPMLQYKPDWDAAKARLTAWWRRADGGRPAMRVVCRRETPLAPPIPLQAPVSARDRHTDVRFAVDACLNYMATREFRAEAYPNTNVNLGPGSLALYLGAEPEFAHDTVWFREVVEDWRAWPPLRFTADNPWWLFHQDCLRRQCREGAGRFLVNIPDLVENIDILAAMRGPQAMCYDLIDQPGLVHDRLDQLDDLYFSYYDCLYDLVKDDDDGSSSFTAFQIWGPGRTAKLQCDFSALMSPTQFRDFIVPSLRRQCQRLDCSLYHLDGPDAIRHVEALMEIDELDALQWTAGAGHPDGGDPCWYPLVYDKVRAAGKSLWVGLGGPLEQCVRNAEAMVRRYGANHLYFLFPEMSAEEADRLLAKAGRDWC